MDRIYSPFRYITGLVFSNTWYAALKKATQLNSISILELIRKYLSKYIHIFSKIHIHIASFTPKAVSSHTPQLFCNTNQGMTRGDNRELCFEIEPWSELKRYWICIYSLEENVKQEQVRVSSIIIKPPSLDIRVCKSPKFIKGLWL